MCAFNNLRNLQRLLYLIRIMYVVTRRFLWAYIVLYYIIWVRRGTHLDHIAIKIKIGSKVISVVKCLIYATFLSVL